MQKVNIVYFLLQPALLSICIKLVIKPPFASLFIDISFHLRECVITN